MGKLPYAYERLSGTFTSYVWWGRPTHPLRSGEWGALNKPAHQPIRAQIFIEFAGKGFQWVRFRAWLRAEAWVMVFTMVK